LKNLEKSLCNLSKNVITKEIKVLLKKRIIGNLKKIRIATSKEANTASGYSIGHR